MALVNRTKTALLAALICTGCNTCIDLEDPITGDRDQGSDQGSDVGQDMSMGDMGNNDPGDMADMADMPAFTLDCGPSRCRIRVEATRDESGQQVTAYATYVDSPLGPGADVVTIAETFSLQTLMVESVVVEPNYAAPSFVGLSSMVHRIQPDGVNPTTNSGVRWLRTGDNGATGNVVDFANGNGLWQALSSDVRTRVYGAEVIGETDASGNTFHQVWWDFSNANSFQISSFLEASTSQEDQLLVSLPTPLRLGPQDADTKGSRGSVVMLRGPDGIPYFWDAVQPGIDRVTGNNAIAPATIPEVDQDFDRTAFELLDRDAISERYLLVDQPTGGISGLRFREVSFARPDQYSVKQMGGVITNPTGLIASAFDRGLVFLAVADPVDLAQPRGEHRVTVSYWDDSEPTNFQLTELTTASFTVPSRIVALDIAVVAATDVTTDNYVLVIGALWEDFSFIDQKIQVETIDIGR